MCRLSLCDRLSRSDSFPHTAATLAFGLELSRRCALAGGLTLDGANDYVTFGTAPGLGASTFTIETWFKRTGTGIPANTGSGGLTAVPLRDQGTRRG